MELFYDSEVDIAGVSFIEGPAARTVFLDNERTIEYSANGAVMGVEFLGASAGVRVLGLPIDARRIGEALKELGLSVLDDVRDSEPVWINRTSSSSSAVSRPLVASGR